MTAIEMLARKHQRILKADFKVRAQESPSLDLPPNTVI
jgi:hypothetical protein